MDVAAATDAMRASRYFLVILTRQHTRRASMHRCCWATATLNQGKVQLGEGAPVFAPRAIRSGEKVERDAATRNQGKVQLGEGAPVFGR